MKTGIFNHVNLIESLLALIDAFLHLYKRVCTSVRRLVQPSVLGSRFRQNQVKSSFLFKPKSAGGGSRHRTIIPSTRGCIVGLMGLVFVSDDKYSYILIYSASTTVRDGWDATSKGKKGENKEWKKERTE